MLESNLYDILPAYHHVLLRRATTAAAAASSSPHLFKRASNSVKIGAPVGSMLAFFIVGGLVYTAMLMYVDHKTRKQIMPDPEDEHTTVRRLESHELAQPELAHLPDSERERERPL